jgi:lysozyme
MAIISNRAILLATSLLRDIEGLELKPYLDEAGIPTIGIGCVMIDGKPVTLHTPPITEAKAVLLMNDVLAGIAPKLAAMVECPLGDHEAGALVSFQYNVGTGALRGSTLLRKLNAGDKQGAADEFGKWVLVKKNGRLVQSNGLVRRRTLERAMFLGTDAPQLDPVEHMTAPPPLAPFLSEADQLNEAELVRLRGIYHVGDAA